MCQGKGSLSHNNREFSAKNIDSSRTADNIVFVRQDLGETYDQLFGTAVERYNARQKRNDRKISEPKKSRGYSYTTEEYGKHQDEIRRLKGTGSCRA